MRLFLVIFYYFSYFACASNISEISRNDLITDATLVYDRPIRIAYENKNLVRRKRSWFSSWFPSYDSLISKAKEMKKEEIERWYSKTMQKVKSLIDRDSQNKSIYNQGPIPLDYIDRLNFTLIFKKIVNTIEKAKNETSKEWFPGQDDAIIREILEEIFDFVLELLAKAPIHCVEKYWNDIVNSFRIMAEDVNVLFAFITRTDDIYMKCVGKYIRYRYPPETENNSFYWWLAEYDLYRPLIVGNCVKEHIFTIKEIARPAVSAISLGYESFRVVHQTTDPAVIGAKCMAFRSINKILEFVDAEFQKKFELKTKWLYD